MGSPGLALSRRKDSGDAGPGASNRAGSEPVMQIQRRHLDLGTTREHSPTAPLRLSSAEGQFPGLRPASLTMATSYPTETGAVNPYRLVRTMTAAGVCISSQFTSPEPCAGMPVPAPTNRNPGGKNRSHQNRPMFPSRSSPRRKPRRLEGYGTSPGMDRVCPLAESPLSLTTSTNCPMVYTL
ncbi:hypothetical protein LZ30DRAFT_188385 [Colletotrichum cereale]|nr:hypothetical protein LZ30DRAFT_188385 [Colletotrichum cereale]